MMRDLFWQIFTVTGNVDAYMLYRGSEEMNSTDEGKDEESTEEEQTEA